MLAAQVRKVSSRLGGPLRYREIDGQVLVTNEAGDWAWVTPDAFRGLLEGTLPDGDPAAAALQGLLPRGGEVDAIAGRLRARRAWLRAGPSRHVVALTRRTPFPPQIEATDAPDDMRPEIAERACDTAFMTTSTTLALDLVGGEPLYALPLVRHVADYARRKNKLSLKELTVSVATTLVGLDNDKGAALIDLGAALHASVDTPFLRDDADRAQALRGMERLAAKLAIRGVIALSARTAGPIGALIADHVRAGCHAVELRPTTALDVALWGEAAAPATVPATLVAWETGVRQLIDASRGGTPVVEMRAATFLRRILGLDDAPSADPRSPGVDGLGQLAYDVDGRVYSSEAGRLTGLLGDDTFLLGTVNRQGYHDLVSHPTVRALVMATTLDGQPGWADSAYAPFCGVSAVENLWEQGSIHGRMADSAQAQLQLGMLDFLFRLVRDADPSTRAVLDAWAQAAS